MMNNFFAIGHITNDLEPVPHLGGGVSYSSLAAKRLGFGPHIITKCLPNHPYIDELKNAGIEVSNLVVRDPQFETKITTFKNFYDEKGRRRQIVPQVQEKITIDDLKNFPNIPEGSIILIATVAAEVDEELFFELSHLGDLAITPQGYFRKIEPDGIVTQIKWEKVNALAHAKITVLSDEDITFDKEKGIDTEFLQKIKDNSKIVVLTQGEKGATVFEKDKEPIYIKAFPLREDELKDFTGAGDTYASAFITRYQKINDLKDASIFAALCSALKIAGIEGGIGLASIPRLETVQTFIENNRDRFNQFLKENGVVNFSLYLEGNNRGVEKNK